MKKKDLRLERKKHRLEENKMFILQAAETVFAQKGYSLATMDDIALEAQFSKATLYRYYKSKREVFFEVILNSFEEVRKKTAKIKLKKITAEEKIRELIFYISTYYHKKKNMARILYMERSVMRNILNIDIKKHLSHSTQHPQIPNEFKENMEEIFNIICEIIKEGIESGEFRKVDVRDAAFIFGALLRGFHFRGPLRGREYRIKESTDLLLNFFLYGIKKEGKAGKGERR